MDNLNSMTPFRHRKALALSSIFLAAALGLIGCSSPSTGDGVSGDPSAETTDDATSGGAAVGCPTEMDDIVSAGGEVEIERISPSDYVVPGLGDALLADACLYTTTNGDKTAQWAWFRGDDASAVATAITDALASAGYTLEDEADGGAQLYSSASDPSITVSPTATAEQAAAAASQPIFDLLGPNVSVFQYYS